MSMIQVSHLTFGYEGSFDNIFEDVSFQIDTDWKLGFIGRNGRGKTTFLNLLLGRYEYTGTITHSVEFEYFPYPVEDREEMTLTILEGIAPEAQLWEIQRELSLLEVEEGVLYRPFSTLSNGEQTKTLLAALFLKENRFLLIDEPTNHLDTLAREKVGEYLAGKKGFILVSHDRAFLDRCVDHVLSINRADIEVQRGNYSSWQQNKDRQDQRELAENEQLKKDIKRLEQAARRTAGWSDAVEKTKKGTRNAGLRPDRGFIGHKAAKMMKRAKSIEARREDAAQEKAELLHNLEQAGRLKLPYTPYYKETLLEATDLSLFYGEKIAVKEVSFTVKRGERVALVGRNGVGEIQHPQISIGGGSQGVWHAADGQWPDALLCASGHLLFSGGDAGIYPAGRAGRKPVQSHFTETGFLPCPAGEALGGPQPRAEEENPPGPEPLPAGSPVYLG